MAHTPWLLLFWFVLVLAKDAKVAQVEEATHNQNQQPGKDLHQTCHKDALDEPKAVGLHDDKAPQAKVDKPRDEVWQQEAKDKVCDDQTKREPDCCAIGIFCGPLGHNRHGHFQREGLDEKQQDGSDNGHVLFLVENRMGS